MKPPILPLALVALTLTACGGGADHGAPAPSATPSAPAPSAPPAAAASTTAPPQPARADVAAPREGQSLAREPGAAFLWIADEDGERVQRVAIDDALGKAPRLTNPPTVAHVEARAVDAPMPGRPAQVLPLDDGRVLVSVRSDDPAGGSASVDGGKHGLVVALSTELSTDGKVRELFRVEVPADAWGLAVTPDKKTALVTSAWTHTLTAIDLDARTVRWSIETAREPRGVVVTADGKTAYVTHLVGGDLTRVDLGGAPRAERLKLAVDPLRLQVGETISASLGYAATLSPDGRRLFVARHALGSGGAWQGAPTIDVLATATGEGIAKPRTTPAFGTLTKDDLTANPWGMDRGGAFLGSAPTSWVVPRALAYRRATDQLLVASEAMGTLAELDARAVAPALVVNRVYELGGLPPTDPTTIQIAPDCGAPTGIALSADESIAWVHCRATDTLVAVRLTPNGARGRRVETEHAEQGKWIRTLSPWGPFAVASLKPAAAKDDAALALGRRLFYDGTEPGVSGGASCATCHPEGRDDGHVWRELVKYAHERRPTFIAGPSIAPEREPRPDGIQYGMARQTPMLAGRVDAKGPYGWHGESGDVEARVRAGFALHRWWDRPADELSNHRRGEPLARFVKTGLVPPPHPARELTSEEQAGKAIFDSPQAKCASCHVPATGFTDRSNVVVPLATPRLFDEDPNKLFRVPSLRFVGETAPYYHDGSAPTLEALVEGNKDRMGKTTHLDEAGRRALVAYLRTL